MYVQTVFHIQIDDNLKKWHKVFFTFSDTSIKFMKAEELQKCGKKLRQFWLCQDLWWYRIFGVFIVNFEHISHLVLVLLLLIFNIFHTLFWCFYF